MQCACTILSFVSCMILLHLSTLFHKVQDFCKNVLEHKICFDFLYKIVSNISHCNRNSARHYNYSPYVFIVKYRLFLFDFNESWISSTDFRKILKNQFPWKHIQWNRVFPYGQTDVRTDGEKEVSKIIVAFRNFANAPEVDDFFWDTT